MLNANFKMQNAKCKMMNKKGVFLRSVKENCELPYLLKLPKKDWFASSQVIESLVQEAEKGFLICILHS
jgi:hypothetical protein